MARESSPSNRSEDEYEDADAGDAASATSSPRTRYPASSKDGSEYDEDGAEGEASTEDGEDEKGGDTSAPNGTSTATTPGTSPSSSVVVDTLEGHNHKKSAHLESKKSHDNEKEAVNQNGEAGSEGIESPTTPVSPRPTTIPWGANKSRRSNVPAPLTLASKATVGLSNSPTHLDDAGSTTPTSLRSSRLQQIASPNQGRSSADHSLNVLNDSSLRSLSGNDSAPNSPSINRQSISSATSKSHTTGMGSYSLDSSDSQLVRNSLSGSTRRPYSLSSEPETPSHVSLAQKSHANSHGGSGHEEGQSISRILRSSTAGSLDNVNLREEASGQGEEGEEEKKKKNRRQTTIGTTGSKIGGSVNGTTSQSGLSYDFLLQRLEAQSVPYHSNSSMASETNRWFTLR
jgi:hypothetical protein